MNGRLAAAVRGASLRCTHCERTYVGDPADPHVCPACRRSVYGLGRTERLGPDDVEA